jgi:hypothetical protein
MKLIAEGCRFLAEPTTHSEHSELAAIAEQGGYVCFARATVRLANQLPHAAPDPHTASAGE